MASSITTWTTVIGEFSKTQNDPRWYASAIPIWQTAERAGLKTESVLWPGHNGPEAGVTPDHWNVYDEKLTGDQRVDKVLAWENRSANEQPDLILLYFDIVDEEGHRFGPDSAEVNAAIASVDASIGRLTAGLAARHITPDMIVVSDHGMAPVSPKTLAIVDDEIDLKGAHWVGRLAVATIQLPDGPDRARELKALTAPHAHYTCWAKDKVPARYHYGANPRIADVVCESQVGWGVTDRAFAPKWMALMKAPHGFGNHGYDPQNPLMGALFVANGPDFKRGVTIAPIPNLDVYPLMAKLLSIRPERHDGSLAEVQDILVH